MSSDKISAGGKRYTVQLFILARSGTVPGKVLDAVTARLRDELDFALLGLDIKETVEKE